MADCPIPQGLVHLERVGAYAATTGEIAKRIRGGEKSPPFFLFHGAFSV